MGLLYSLLAVFKSFFDSNTQAGKVVEKALPSPELQKQIYEDKKKRKEPIELMRDFKKARRFLSKPWNKAIDIDNHVEYAYGSFEEKDKMELKRMLHEVLER